MSDAENALLVQVLTLFGILTSIAWNTIQRRQINKSRVKDNEDRALDILQLQTALLERIDNNTRLTELAGDKAMSAFHEANNVNQKIANLHATQQRQLRMLRRPRA